MMAGSKETEELKNAYLNIIEAEELGKHGGFYCKGSTLTENHVDVQYLLKKFHGLGKPDEECLAGVVKDLLLETIQLKVELTELKSLLKERE